MTENKSINKIIIKENDKNDIEILVYQDENLIEQYSEKNDQKRLEGNIYWGKVDKIVEGMQEVFIDIGIDKKALAHVDDIVLKENMKDCLNQNNEKPNIKKVIKPTDKIIVQVKKDGVGEKGPKVTKNIKLFGRYVILMPFSKIITISNKIKNEAEKQRIINILKNRNMQYGVIARTLAKEVTAKEINEDIDKLLDLWDEIKLKIVNEKAPKLLYDNQGLLGKIITDLDTNNVQIITNSENVKKRIEIIDDNAKVLIGNIKNTERTMPRKVWLKCGAYITIDMTEALVAIDVNSAKCIGKKDAEENILKVNKEAAKQIAKEIRLRDLGGIIVIDFIDMQKEKDREEVKKIITNELSQDRAKVQVFEFTKLGLLEIARKPIFANEKKTIL